MENGSPGGPLTSSNVAEVSLMASRQSLSLAISPNLSIFINRKTRFVNTPNATYDEQVNNSQGTGSVPQQLVSTPVASSSAAKRLRRDDIRVNPFEKHLLEQLHRSAWSPSVFTESGSETPPQRNWSVDEISLLNPSKIEESPSSHQDEEVLTPQTEARAQHAISMFFSQHIVPSPSPKIVPLDNSEGAPLPSPITPVAAEVCGIDGDVSAAVNTSVRRRKLTFTLSPITTEVENMEVSETSAFSGEVLHSPGFSDGEAISPRHFREGMDSPNVTPIRLGNEDRTMTES